MMAELGMVTPPVAIHVYIVQGVTKVPMVQIFRGEFLLELSILYL
jgi:TRAP-type C4-dicarboxylate transport system permease large subunit